MAALAQPVPQEAAVAEMVRSLTLPKGVRLKTTFFDVDHSGDPAVYVVFAVSKQYGLGPARIRSLTSLRERVLRAFDSLGLDQLCYVRFVDVK
jgi:hypothetical protein